MRKEAREIFQASVEAANPSRCIHQNVRLRQGILHIGQAAYVLSELSKIFVVGAGKASVPMAEAFEQILGGSNHRRGNKHEIRALPPFAED